MIDGDDLPKGAILLAVIILASAMAMPIVPNTPSSNARTGDVQTAQPSDVTQPNEPAGEFYSVPDSHTQTPSSLPEPEVRASNGSQTMQLAVVQAEDDVALELSDDRVHDGRWVSVSPKWFQEVYGEVPDTAYVEHESGSSYSTTVHVRDDEAAFYVREFSTNEVTFSGEVTIDAHAGDGSTFTYNLSDLDSASDPEGTLTGVNVSEWDNVTASGLSNNDYVSVDPAGHFVEGPAGGEPEITFSGEVIETSQTESGTNITTSDSVSVSVDGNADPGGPNGDPELTLTASRWKNKDSTYYDDLTTMQSTTFSNIPETIETACFHADDAFSGSTPDMDGYLVVNGQNITIAEDASYGTHCKDVNVDTGTDDTAVIKQRDDYSNPHSDYRYITAPLPSSVEVTASDGTTASFGAFSDGESKTVAMDLSHGVSSLDVSGSGRLLDWTLEYTERIATEDPAVDVDGDGTNEVSHSGILLDGESASYAAPSLDTSDDTVQISTSTGSTTQVDVKLQEVVESRDVTVSLNGEQIGSSPGRLPEGDTASFSTLSSDLQSGENTLSVTVGDGSLSADAPTPAVDVAYSHDAHDKQSVTYEAEQWTERYHLSHTWASARENATLTIPFETDVMSIRGLELRTNGSSWQPVDQSAYTLDGTTLTVDLGTVRVNEQTEVRANGSRVQVMNGAIDVRMPSIAGDDLNTTIEVTSHSEDFYIAYAGVSGQIYYTQGESWSSPDSYHYADASGHKRLYLPNAAAGATVEVHDLPVTARPGRGEVHITSTNGSTTEPSFHVQPGNESGNPVEYTFQNASDGTEYILYSKTEGVVHDSGTASSPLTLTDDDSSETLVFQIDDGSTSSSGGGGGGGGVGSVGPMPTSPEGASWGPLLGIAVALAGLVIAGNNPQAVEETSDHAGKSVESLLAAIPVVGDGLGRAANSIVTGTGGAVAGFVAHRIAVVAVGGAIVLGGITAGIIPLPANSLVIFVVAGVAIGSGLLVQEYDWFTRDYWTGTVVVAGVVALQIVSPADASLFTSIVESRVFPLLAAGGLYLAYRAIKSWREANATPDTQVVVAGQTQQGGDD